METSHRDPVDLLAEEFAERLRVGERPSVEDYVLAHPRWEARIRELFPALEALEQLGGRSLDAHGAPAPGGEFPAQLGDYRITREIGRGGMGIVYEAVQVSLGRRVALKALPRGTAANENRSRRFLREAQSAGRLQHAHIVPVIDVGEHEGVSFFTMQLVDGEGLDRVLSELERMESGPAAPSPAAPGGAPETVADSSAKSAAWRLAAGELSSDDGAAKSEYSSRLPAEFPGGVRSSERFFRNVARLGVQAADALAFAHSQEILHRDVKPANLLLDSGGKVWVTDFGLAKVMDDLDLTHTGDIVGTVRYMSPERFDGWADSRSDVYGLGLTLYELLTGRPGFADRDRARLIRSILEDEPSPPRRINPRIPLDLETIVLKSIAKEPAARYPSAAAQRDDLLRLLRGEPIQARRSSPWQRWRLWSKRNPGAAWLTVSLAVLLAAATLGSIVSAVLIDRQRNDAVQSAKDARVAEAEARSSERRERKARQQANQQLYEAAMNQSRLGRALGKQGQRTEGLAALRRVDQRDLSAGQVWAMRNEAIACLCLVDLQEVTRHDAETSFTRPPLFDAAIDRYAVQDEDRCGITIRRLADDRVVAHPRQIPDGIGNAMTRMQFSPDGKYLASVFFGNGLLLWKIGRDEPIFIAAAAENLGFTMFDFSRDGRWLAYGNERDEAIVLELSSLKAVNIYPAEGAGAIRFHPLTDELLIVGPQAVVAHDIIGRRARSFTLPAAATGSNNFALGRDGETLAVFSHRGVELLPPQDAVEIIDADKSAGGAFNPKFDLLLASQKRGSVLLCPFRRRQLLETESTATAFDSGGEWVGFYDRDGIGRARLLGTREYRVWRAGRDARDLGGSWALETTADGRILATTAFPVISGGKAAKSLPISPRLRGMIGGRGDHLGAVNFWSLESGVRLPIDPVDVEADGETTAIRLFTDGTRAAVCRIRPASRGRPAESDVCVCRVERGGDGLTLTGAAPISAQVASLPGFQPRDVSIRANGRMLLVKHRPGTRRPYYGEEAAWFIYDLRRGAELAHPKNKIFASVDLSPDGELVAMAPPNSGPLEIWDVPLGEVIRRIDTGGLRRTATFSPDGRRLAVGQQADCQVYDARTWKLAYRLPHDNGNSPAGGCHAFSPGGEILAVAHSFSRIVLHDAAGGAELAALNLPHDRPLTSLAFSRDARWLLAATDDGLIHVWDLPLIRRGLSEMGLDFDWPAPPAVSGER